MHHLRRASILSFAASTAESLCWRSAALSAPLGREGAHGAPGVLAGSVDDLVKAWVSSLIPLGTTLQVAGQIFSRPARNDRSNPIASAARSTLLSASYTRYTTEQSVAARLLGHH